MKMNKVLVTPSYAKELLERNTNNRRVNDVTLNRYYRDIIENKWKEDTGECIKISKSKRILDGQHRLMAIVKANKSIYLHIIEDLDDSVFDVIDTGKSRSSTDTFKVKGVKNDNIIPSTITKYIAFTKGKSKLDSRSELMSNSDILKIYENRENFWQLVAKKSMNWYGQFAKILTPSQFGALFAFFHDVSSKDAENFMNQLATGNDVTNISISLLRTKLMNDKVSMKKMPQELRLALIIKSWNFYRKNERPKILKWDSTNEKFPIAI